MLVINDEVDLTKLAEDLSYWCGKYNDCKKCKARYRCRSHYDRKLAVENPRPKDFRAYLMIITSPYRKNNHKRKDTRQF